MNIDQRDVKISIEEMQTAIARSGYLIEQRVEATLSKNNFQVITSPIFVDPVTGKDREYDVLAYHSFEGGQYKEHRNRLHAHLVCECENNQQPVVFFHSPSEQRFFYAYSINLLSFPKIIYKKPEEHKWPMISEIECYKNHHLSNQTIPLSNQYCSFNFKEHKGQLFWTALHIDQQHDTINKTIKALNYTLKKFEPSFRVVSFPSVSIFYPLIILQGDMYYYSAEGKMEETNHVIYRKTIYDGKEEKSYMIDIIKEGYLESYLALVKNTLKRIDNSICNIEHLERSIEIETNKQKSEVDFGE